GCAAHAALALAEHAADLTRGDEFAVLAGVRELVWDRAVPDRYAFGGAAEEAPAVADREQVRDDVNRDERDRDDGQAREGDVVSEREHAELGSPPAANVRGAQRPT